MRFVKNQAGNIEETRYAYVGSSENNLLTVTKDYVEEEKIQEKKKRAPNPLRDLEGNRDLDGNQDRNTTICRGPSPREHPVLGRSSAPLSE